MAATGNKNTIKALDGVVGANSAELRDKILKQVLFIRIIELHNRNRPSGTTWVQFDHAHVGEKTRYDYRHLFVQGIKMTWTPIKPFTAQFAVGRNRTHQVLRK